MESNRNKHLGVRKVSETNSDHKSSIQVTGETSSSAYMIDNILGNTNSATEDDEKSVNFTNASKSINTYNLVNLVLSINIKHCL